MPRKIVRQKLQAYLERGIAERSILSVGTVFPHPPKITKLSDLYKLTPPGVMDGAVMYMYLSEQAEIRLAIGGAHSGRKGRVYHLTLVCYLVWRGNDAQAADAANDDFIDSLTGWIEADRNAGTEAVSLGGDGSGVIFSWGEGIVPSAIPGGKDIQVHAAMPRDVGGQSTVVFTTLDIAVIETLAT